MNSQKQENMLSLAMDSTRQEREKSGILSVGIVEEKKRWEVIVKYHGNIERIVSEEVQVERLIAGYAIVTLSLSSSFNVSEDNSTPYTL